MSFGKSLRLSVCFLALTVSFYGISFAEEVKTEAAVAANPPKAEVVEDKSPSEPKVPGMKDMVIDGHKVSVPAVDSKKSSGSKKYRDFLSNVGKTVFSKEKRKLSSETATLLESITADSLPTLSRPLIIRNEVKIEKFNAPNPFAGTDGQPGDPIIGKERGLEITVRTPDNTKLKNMQLAYDAFQSGQYESAVFFYKKVIAEEENNKDALFGLATTYHRGGQLEEARDTYIKLINIDQNNWAALNNFLVLASEESPDEALRQLQGLEKSNPEFAPVPAQMGMIYIQQNNLNEAAKSMARAVSLAPDNVSYRYILAVVLDKLGNNETAVKLYRQVIDAGRQGKELPESPSKILDRIAALTEISAQQQQQQVIDGNN